MRSPPHLCCVAAHASFTHARTFLRLPDIRYADNRKALAGICQALMLTKTMLFVGFSLQDDNFHSLFDAVKKARHDPDAVDADPTAAPPPLLPTAVGAGAGAGAGAATATVVPTAASPPLETTFMSSKARRKASRQSRRYAANVVRIEFPTALPSRSRLFVSHSSATTKTAAKAKCRRPSSARC